MGESKKSIGKNDIATIESTTPTLTDNETASIVQDKSVQESTLQSSLSGTSLRRLEEESSWTETFLNGEISNNLPPPVSPPPLSAIKNNGPVKHDATIQAQGMKNNTGSSHENGGHSLKDYDYTTDDALETAFKVTSINNNCLSTTSTVPAVKEKSGRDRSSYTIPDNLASNLPLGVTLADLEEDAEMRRILGRLNRSWGGDMSIHTLERRLRDFKFARNMRKTKYGKSKPWGILGLYDHLAEIRADVEWAEDAAWRRENNEPYFSWSDFDQVKDLGLNKTFFTYIILFVCTFTLIYSFALNGWRIEELTKNPMIGPSGQTLLDMGAKQSSLIVNQGEWFRIFAPMFLHAGLVHYVLNMLALWFIGSAVEKAHGFINAAILFAIPAICGTLLSAVFLPQYITVGASGGIFGLIGACVADIVKNWSLLFDNKVIEDSSLAIRHYRVVFILIVDIVLNCIVGFTPLIDNFTHLGGMIFGFLLGLSAMEKLSSDFFGIEKGFNYRLKQIFIRFFGLIISVIAITITVAVLADSDGVSIPCDKCRYFSCIPFPPWQPEEKRWWNCDDCGLVTADARRDHTNTYFAELILTCPDKQVEWIDISDGNLTDGNDLAKKLVFYCRTHCENIIA